MSDTERISKQIIALMKTDSKPFYIKYTTFAGNIVKDFSRDIGYSSYEYFDTENRWVNRLDSDRLFRRIKFGISNDEIRKIIVLVVGEFTRNSRKHVTDIIAEQAGKASGRIFINSILLQDMASYLTSKLLPKIIFNATFTLSVTIAGARARSLYVSRKLKNKSPSLFYMMRKKDDLDLFYFLVDDYLEPFIDALSIKENNEEEFHEIIKNILSGIN